MRKVAIRPGFSSLPLCALIPLSMLAGSLLGFLVMGPICLMALADKSALWAMNWALTGATSGALTSCLITLIYRYDL